MAPFFLEAISYQVNAAASLPMLVGGPQRDRRSPGHGAEDSQGISHRHGGGSQGAESGHGGCVQGTIGATTSYASAECGGGAEFRRFHWYSGVSTPIVVLDSSLKVVELVLDAGPCEPPRDPCIADRSVLETYSSATLTSIALPMAWPIRASVNATMEAAVHEGRPGL